MCVFADNMTSELHHVIKKVIKKVERRKRKSTTRFCFVTEEVLSGFATAKNVNLNWLQLEAKRLQLIRTVSGRQSRNDRIGFGLPLGLARELKPCPRTLFTFGKSKTTGLFNGSAKNHRSVICYLEMAKRYFTTYFITSLDSLLLHSFTTCCTTYFTPSLHTSLLHYILHYFTNVSL